MKELEKEKKSTVGLVNSLLKILEKLLLKKGCSLLTSKIGGMKIIRFLDLIEKNFQTTENPV